MTQSVELTLDATADATIRDQWARLAAAGLPTEQRTVPSPSHRPHVTLFAGPVLSPGSDAALPGLLAGLDLELRIGGLLLFGPRRGSYVLVRPVVPHAGLLALQAAVAERCEADPAGHFGPGRWTPHVTLARRVRADQVGDMLAVLGEVPELEVRSRQCRRWDSDRREDWLLTGA